MATRNHTSVVRSHRSVQAILSAPCHPRCLSNLSLDHCAYLARAGLAGDARQPPRLGAMAIPCAVGQINAAEIVRWMTDRQQEEFACLGLSFTGLRAVRRPPSIARACSARPTSGAGRSHRGWVRGFDRPARSHDGQARCCQMQVSDAGVSRSSRSARLVVRGLAHTRIPNSMLRSPRSLHPGWNST